MERCWLSLGRLSKPRNGVVRPLVWRQLDRFEPVRDLHHTGLAQDVRQVSIGGKACQASAMVRRVVDSPRGIHRVQIWLGEQGLK